MSNADIASVTGASPQYRDWLRQERRDRLHRAGGADRDSCG